MSEEKRRESAGRRGVRDRASRVVPAPQAGAGAHDPDAPRRDVRRPARAHRAGPVRQLLGDRQADHRAPPGRRLPRRRRARDHHLPPAPALDDPGRVSAIEAVEVAGQAPRGHRQAGRPDGRPAQAARLGHEPERAAARRPGLRLGGPGGLAGPPAPARRHRADRRDRRRAARARGQAAPPSSRRWTAGSRWPCSSTWSTSPTRSRSTSSTSPRSSASSRSSSTASARSSAPPTRRCRGSTSRTPPTSAWSAAAATTSATPRRSRRYDDLSVELLNDIDKNLTDAASDARGLAIANAVVTVALLLAAIFLALLISRMLLNPIRRVREGALEVANTRLPEMVAKIRSGGDPGEITPIPVHTHEEMGQLARAVDDMHRQAVHLASGEAKLRSQVGEMFSTLSRRNTSLINQQLGLIERLEKDEEDPNRLESLFRLDHLASRMRRTGDSLMVLADAPMQTSDTDALALGDVFQAAMAGVQEYQRVQIESSPAEKVNGAAAADVVHLMTELVDNALAFSPPTAPVKISTKQAGDSTIVEVSDGGLGIAQDVLNSLNEDLRSGGEVTVETARRMGLLVVSRIATRHGITVSLARNAARRYDGHGAAPAGPAARPAGAGPAQAASRTGRAHARQVGAAGRGHRAAHQRGRAQEAADPPRARRARRAGCLAPRRSPSRPAPAAPAAPRLRPLPRPRPASRMPGSGRLDLRRHQRRHQRTAPAFARRHPLRWRDARRARRLHRRLAVPAAPGQRQQRHRQRTAPPSRSCRSASPPRRPWRSTPSTSALARPAADEAAAQEAPEVEAPEVETPDVETRRGRPRSRPSRRRARAAGTPSSRRTTLRRRPGAPWRSSAPARRGVALASSPVSRGARRELGGRGPGDADPAARRRDGLRPARLAQPDARADRGRDADLPRAALQLAHRRRGRGHLDDLGDRGRLGGRRAGRRGARAPAQRVRAADAASRQAAGARWSRARRHDRRARPGGDPGPARRARRRRLARPDRARAVDESVPAPSTEEGPA